MIAGKIDRLHRQAQLEFIEGIKTELPIAAGVVPFGLIYGVLALEAGLSPLLAVGSSSIVLAGSAQFLAAQLIATGAPAAIILLTTLIINLRHLLYSASVAPHLKHLSVSWKWLLAYLLTDEAYMVAISRYNDDASPAAGKHWFFLGAGLTLWVSWQASTVAGVLLGAQVPAGWSLDFTLALTFIGLIVPALKDRPALGAALAAGIVALATALWPYKLGLMAAALAGIACGVWLENKR
jgi:4-azaleucine resistance transporter AzlC